MHTSHIIAVIVAIALPIVDADANCTASNLAAASALSDYAPATSYCSSNYPRDAIYDTYTEPGTTLTSVVATYYVTYSSSAPVEIITFGQTTVTKTVTQIAKRAATSTTTNTKTTTSAKSKTKSKSSSTIGNVSNPTTEATSAMTAKSKSKTKSTSSSTVGTVTTPTTDTTLTTSTTTTKSKSKSNSSSTGVTPTTLFTSTTPQPTQTSTSGGSSSKTTKSKKVTTSVAATSSVDQAAVLSSVISTGDDAAVCTCIQPPITKTATVQQNGMVGVTTTETRTLIQQSATYLTVPTLTVTTTVT